MTNALMTRRITRSMNELSEQTMRNYAPSIFAEHAAEGRGAGYKFYNTYALVLALKERGWYPIQCFESNTRIEGQQGYQKHMIRLRHHDESNALANVGDTVFNLLLVNSHNGGSSYQLHAGLLRLACTNGLIVADKTFEPIRLRHAKFETEDVIDAQARVLDELPRIGDSVQEFQKITLTTPERIEFARAALELRWESDDNGKSTSPIKAEDLLHIQRYDDRKNDLYTTYNVVQENLVKGGLHGQTTNGKPTSTRAVTGVDGNIKLNKALWTLTEAMAKLKA